MVLVVTALVALAVVLAVLVVVTKEEVAVVGVYCQALVVEAVIPQEMVVQQEMLEFLVVLMSLALQEVEAAGVLLAVLVAVVTEEPQEAQQFQEHQER